MIEINIPPEMNIVKTEMETTGSMRYFNINVDIDEIEYNPDIVTLFADDEHQLEYVSMQTINGIEASLEALLYDDSQVESKADAHDKSIHNHAILLALDIINKCTEGE